ncbi:MAG: CcmD family protein [Gemmatimonadales bacterium]
MSRITSPLPRSHRWLLTTAALTVLLAMGVAAVEAQTGGRAAAGVGGMRAYWHVFIAYAIVILMVLGWVISIGRRLKDIQQRLGGE